MLKQSINSPSIISTLVNVVLKHYAVKLNEAIVD